MANSSFLFFGSNFPVLSSAGASVTRVDDLLQEQSEEEEGGDDASAEDCDKNPAALDQSSDKEETNINNPTIQIQFVLGDMDKNPAISMLAGDDDDDDDNIGEKEAAPPLDEASTNPKHTLVSNLLGETNTEKVAKKPKGPLITELSRESKNITWHYQKVSREERWQVGGHGGAVLWFTGLSGAGKSSIANQLEMILNRKGFRTYLLDGDNIRHGLCKDLGFSLEDRAENIRRVGQVSKLMADAGVVVLAALISPYRADRDEVRESVASASFVEIHVKASLETCEGRDPKGLYQLAREGKIKNFTGIDDPYEEPLNPQVTLDSDNKTVQQLADEVASFLVQNETLKVTTIL
jgi:adenylylsulfate kinase